MISNINKIPPKSSVNIFEDSEDKIKLTIIKSFGLNYCDCLYCNALAADKRFSFNKKLFYSVEELKLFLEESSNNNFKDWQIKEKNKPKLKKFLEKFINENIYY